MKSIYNPHEGFNPCKDLEMERTSHFGAESKEQCGARKKDLKVLAIQDMYFDPKSIKYINYICLRC